MEHLPQSTLSSLRIPEGKTVHHINAEQLEYIQADGAYCRFHTAGQVKTIRIGLKQAADLLPRQFVRISRSVIINRKKISWTRTLSNSMEIELESGIQFIASKNYPGIFLE